MDFFNIDALLHEARRRSGGLDNFSGSDFLPALHALVSAFNQQARFSSDGRYLMRHRLVELLKNRLVLQDYWQRHPDIADEQILAPLIIIGLPRTGTTLLHRVIAADPRLYCLRWWESRYPAPQGPLSRVVRNS